MGELKDFGCESSATVEGTPVVVAHYDDQAAVLSVAEARGLAKAIQEAVAISETEFRMALLVAGPEPKGFDRKEWDDRFAKTLVAFRKTRPDIHPQVNAIFGMKTGKPLIELLIWPQKAQAFMDEASNFAMWLFESAEAAETDGFLRQFGEKIGLEPETTQGLINEFATYRQALMLNNLFNRDLGD